MKKINVLLLILWLIVIFMFSQDSAVSSSEKSDTIASVIVNIISDITHSDNIETYLDNIILFVRKSAHFLEYFILGILTINVFKDYRNISFALCLFALIFCMIYATGDEVHQLFISERNGNAIDILIDSLGSLIGILLYYLIKHKSINKKYLINETS